MKLCLLNKSIMVRVDLLRKRGLARDKLDRIVRQFVSNDHR